VHLSSKDEALNSNPSTTHTHTQKVSHCGRGSEEWIRDLSDEKSTFDEGNIPPKEVDGGRGVICKFGNYGDDTLAMSAPSR
jgi:hypothetical protein